MARLLPDLLLPAYLPLRKAQVDSQLRLPPDRDVSIVMELLLQL